MPPPPKKKAVNDYLLLGGRGRAEDPRSWPVFLNPRSYSGLSPEKISEAINCLETSLHSRRNKVVSSLFFKMYTSRNLGICNVLINNPGVHPCIPFTILVQITECAEKPLLIYLLWADLWELLEMSVNDEFPGKGLYSTGDTGGPAKCL